MEQALKLDINLFGFLLTDMDVKHPEIQEGIQRRITRQSRQVVGGQDARKRGTEPRWTRNGQDPRRQAG